MDIDALEPGQLVTDEVLLVARASLQVDRRGQNYYNLVLNSEDGRQIDGKVWSDNIAGAIEPGVGLEVLARVDEYRGQKQLNIQRYTVLSPEEYDLTPFVRTAEVDAEEGFEKLFDWERDEFEDPALRRLMREFRDNASFAQQFKRSPAATVHHHNYTGGLLEHTLEVWNLADRIGELYPGRFDRDLLMAAAALHDVGKVNAYRLKAGISEPTEVGELLDHVFVSASMVSNLWDSAVRPEVPDERAEEAADTKTRLLHAILAHHGKMEWGSPVLPRTPEAVLIHHCDVISANLHTCFNALEEAPEGEAWTDRVYIMDQARRLFMPFKEEEG
ncbi:MAG: 3'-5' exoribonuclease YhaM family protein [Planctomycetota bacterium]